jgi:hypothetical protein
MRVKRPEYRTEELLVRRFVARLTGRKTPWGRLKVCQEFNYSRGKTDILALSDRGELIAFEAKLTKWRIALQQAFRNTSFAHTSYVLLPRTYVANAEACIHEFDLRQVGLCVLDNDEISIIQVPPRQKPLEPWLHQQALELIRRHNEPTANSRRCGQSSSRGTRLTLREKSRRRRLQGNI